MPVSQRERSSKGDKIADGYSYIAESLWPLAVPVGELIVDPVNARVHPDRNRQAIRASLRAYGQCKPVVARRETRVVIAGNGVLEAARELGWTHLAVAWVDLDAVAAVGYGLADNRVAELATWDYEVLGKLDQLLKETEVEMIGWTEQEISKVQNVLGSEEGHSSELSPDEFKEVDESIEIEHICPRCGYAFSGGQTMVGEEEESP